jgi:NADH-quinone oxidoreductase subunit C
MIATVIRVEAADWYAELSSAATRGLAYLDFLTVIDRLAELEFVAHLVDVDTGERLLVSAALPADGASIASVTGLFPGAGWHEREAAEMFGVEFDGHPDPRPLLTRGKAASPPLRKTTSLAARTHTPWPGADPAARRRARTPGVLDTWTAEDQ